ncbi:MAG: DUF3887 domain-containing protein [Snowella sp.]|nr:DUF3887 domain-containing protein [Snowella sp.]
MNQFRLFSQNYRSISLLPLFLTLGISIPTLNANAQPPLVKSEIAQALTESQTQDLQKQAETLIGLLGKKDYKQVRELLSPELQKFWTVEQIQSIWETELIDKFGPFQKIVSSRVIDVINADVVRVTVQFAKKTEDILVTYDKQQQLIGLDWPSSKNIDQLATRFVNSLVIKDYGRARGDLSPLLKAEFFPDRVQRRWETLLSRTGPFQRIVKITNKPSTTANVPDVVIVKIQFENLTDDLFIFFNKEKQIVNIDFPQ